MRRVLLVLAVAAVACGDNRAASDAPGGDTGGPHDAARHDALPPGDSAPFVDLKLVTAQMDNTILVTEDSFQGSDCELVEGCVGGPGTRRLLRFDTVTENAGNIDLDLGPVPPAGVSSGIYVWSACHMHHHVAGFADYTVTDGSGGVVAVGRKQGFCVEDGEQVEPVVSHGYTCAHQGITPGWADVYSRYTACQWIDVTDLASGTYTLTVTVDGSGALPDDDLTNNTWTSPVSL